MARFVHSSQQREVGACQANPALLAERYKQQGVDEGLCTQALEANSGYITPDLGRFLLHGRCPAASKPTLGFFFISPQHLSEPADYPSF